MKYEKFNISGHPLSSLLFPMHPLPQKQLAPISLAKKERERKRERESIMRRSILWQLASFSEKKKKRCKKSSSWINLTRLDSFVNRFRE
jgi:hypothetical protein